jgi:Zn-dependent alcohol dehydrogenase
MFRSGYYSEQPIFPSMLGFEAAAIIESVGEENIKILVSCKDAKKK